MKTKEFLGQFFTKFNEHDLLTLSAALAFYTALSLAPLLLLTISFLGILGPHASKEFITQISQVIGTQASEAVNLVIAGAQSRSDLSKLGGILGLVVLFFSASGVFSQLQSSLNLIWETPAPKGRALSSWLRHRLISMGMVLSLGFLSLVSLVVTTALSFVFSRVHSAWNVVNLMGTLVVFAFMFGAIYKVLPDKTVSWKDCIKGGLITSALFAVGKEIIGLYLGKSAVGSAYGATGSLIVFLIWVYYSSFILFLGAQLTSLLPMYRGEIPKNQLPDPMESSTAQAAPVSFANPNKGGLDHQPGLN